MKLAVGWVVETDRIGAVQVPGPLPRGPSHRAWLLVVPLLLTGAADTSCAAPAVPVSVRQPAGSCTRYRLPDPNRPAVTLGFAIDPDHRTVIGREHVVFRPDREIRELVFRLWPNGPEGGRTHASLTVRDARVEGRRSGLDLMSAGDGRAPRARC